MYGEYSNNVDTESEITVVASTHASQAELPDSIATVLSPRSEITVKEEHEEVDENVEKPNEEPVKSALPESIVISIEEAPKTENNSENAENQEIPALIVQEPTPAPSVIDGSVATTND